MHIENVIGVHFVLPPSVTKLIMNSCQNAPDKDIRPADLTPHISICYGAIKPEYFSDIVNDVCHADLYQPSIKIIKICNQYCSNKTRYYSQMTVFKNHLSLMHYEILDIINNYRQSNILSKDKENYLKNKITDQDFDHIKKYGSKNTMDKYEPHITLGLYCDLEKYEITEKYFQQKLNPLLNEMILLTQVEIVQTAQDLDTSQYLPVVRHIIDIN